MPQWNFHGERNITAPGLYFIGSPFAANAPLTVSWASAPDNLVQWWGVLKLFGSQRVSWFPAPVILNLECYDKSVMVLPSSPTGENLRAAIYLPKNSPAIGDWIQINRWT